MGKEDKNAVILHGAGETPDSFWLPYLRQGLETRGYSISIPSLPCPETPTLDLWLPAALKETFRSETLLFAHSAGSALALSVLENSPYSIRLAVLVAGYSTPLRGLEEQTKATVQSSYNWKKISQNVGELYLINSDNDPWDCTDQKGREILDHVGKGSLIIKKGEGHMGSDAYDQPYPRFPLLLGLVDSISL